MPPRPAPQSEQVRSPSSPTVLLAHCTQVLRATLQQACAPQEVTRLAAGLLLMGGCLLVNVFTSFFLLRWGY